MYYGINGSEKKSILKLFFLFLGGLSPLYYFVWGGGRFTILEVLMAQPTSLLLCCLRLPKSLYILCLLLNSFCSLSLYSINIDWVYYIEQYCTQYRENMIKNLLDMRTLWTNNNNKETTCWSTYIEWMFNSGIFEKFLENYYSLKWTERGYLYIYVMFSVVKFSYYSLFFSPCHNRIARDGTS